MNYRFAILVLSCDKYSSLWKPFFSQFHKYWSACPYKIYLGSNYKKYTDKRIKTITAKIDKDWSSNLLTILESIKEDNIFIWLDDYFLTDDIDQSLFRKSVKLLISKNLNHIQMRPSLGIHRTRKNASFMSIKRGSPHRVASYGFWNKNHLKKILLPGESPWQFEIYGSYRSSYFDGYLCLSRDLFRFVQVVERGKLFREAYEYCRREGIKLDTAGWKIHTRSHKIISDIKRFIYYRIFLIPWEIRVRVMDFFRKALVSY